jgi:hypothetical protein
VVPKPRKQLIPNRDQLKNSSLAFVTKVMPLGCSSLAIGLSKQIALSYKSEIQPGTLVYVQNIDYCQLVLWDKDSAVEKSRKETVLGEFVKVVHQSHSSVAILDNETSKKLGITNFSKLRYLSL